MSVLESYTTENPFGKSDECAKFTIDDISIPFTLHDITVPDRQYTLGLWVKSSTEGGLVVHNIMLDSDAEWTRHTVTFNAGDIDLDLFFATPGTYYIYHPKLELGNKATDWTEAPEDVDQRLDTAVADINKTITDQETTFVQNSSEIIMSALASYVEKNTGHHVTAVAHYYLASTLSVDVDATTDGWTETIPTVSSSTPHLWTYEVLTYSDSSTVSTSPVLVYTYVDSAISSITEYYGANSDKENPTITVQTVDSSGEIIQTETDLTWYTTIPILSMTSQCLWHYKVLTLADSTATETQKRYIGEYVPSYSEFRETVETQLSLVAGEMRLSFESTNTKLSNVEEEVNDQSNKLSKYFVFNQNGLEIKTGEKATMSLILDNGLISFQKNGEQFGWWDGVDFHTGNIVVDVNERAQFGNFAFIPRSDGSLMFLKVDD